MHSHEPTDSELLTAWFRERHEAAFQQLVARYAGLVHAAAKRTGGNDWIAAEVSQVVFIVLARKAAALAERKSLAGWLHLTAVMETKNQLRKSGREIRKRGLLHVEMETNHEAETVGKWKEIQPVLDAAISGLPEKDREALLLHFHREMNFQQVGEAMGIAAEAARKRISRAIERLRGRLAGKGVIAGDSLHSVLLSGFATDASIVNFPVKLVAAKAMAAAQGSGAGVSATVLMKATSYVSPVIALVVAGLWIAPKREAIASAERRYTQLENEGTSFAGSKSETAKRTTARADHGKNGSNQIDWAAIAEAEMDEQSSGRVLNFRSIDRIVLDRRLEAMAGEELMAELERIGETDVSEEAKEKMLNGLYHVIARKHPKFALEHLAKWLGGPSTVGFALTTALKAYARGNPAEAARWLDRQIAEGRLDVKRLDGRNWDRDRLEGALVQAGMVSSPEQVAERLKAMSPKDLQAALSALPPRMPKDEQIAYAKLVREVIEPADHAKMIARMGIVLNEDFKWVDDYLGRIEATDAERRATYERAATYSLMNTAMNRKLTGAEVLKSWNWMEKRLPESRERLTGEALGNAWSDDRPTGFEDVAGIAVALNKITKDDQLLAAFLKSRGARLKKERSREIAVLIRNENLKAEVMEVLK